MKIRRVMVSTITAGLSVALLLLTSSSGHAGRSGGQDRKPSPRPRPLAAGQPRVLDARAPLSAAVMTSLGGRNTQFSEIDLIANWDGREDYTADRAGKVDDFSDLETDVDQVATRVAISAHTIANGFNENIFYYSDSAGNIHVGVDSNGDADVETKFTIDLPASLNAFGTINSDDQVTITGLAVSPVADLTSFFNVNGAYNEFNGVVGEILYVTYVDTGGGLRLTTNNRLVRSGLLAFPVSDAVSPAAAPPSPISGAGFPVTVGGAFGVAFSEFSMVGGVAVDDDGSVYFHQADLIGLTGGNIVKVASLDSATFQDRSLAVNAFPTLDTLNPAGGVYGNFSGPANQSNRFTNYSGTARLFGNVAAIAAGPHNVVYAAVAASRAPGSDPSVRNTQGPFQSPSPLGATPSMVITFSDVGGGVTASGLTIDNRPAAFDSCTAPAVPSSTGTLPVPNGFADKADASPGSLVAGVNNFRVFALGSGPDIRPPEGATSPIVTRDTLALEMQIDYTSHAGITVDEEGTVYVISGGTPAGVGLNPSPDLSEVLVFPDSCPADRKADFIDLRANFVPIPPQPGGNAGDGDSDRFDHIFWQAPLDQVSMTPTGVSGLARGFLRYTNRLAPNEVSPGVTLGQTGGSATLNDNATAGPILFERLDPSHDVAGGDDSRTPFGGDDSDGLGTPALTGVQDGGFEFLFGTSLPGAVWNGFFLNSNGSLTFGGGDIDFTPSVPEFRSGSPKIAPAWADLNTQSRASGFLNTFPVQAVGFSNVNSFKVRWINVPENGRETCGSRNTFSATLYDDGTGADENTNETQSPNPASGNNVNDGGVFDQQEGPTDSRWRREPVTGALAPNPARREGTGHFVFDYSRMDLLGTASRPVLTGYSLGGLSPLNPPGLCENDLGEAARAADAGTFGVVQGQTASVTACLLGEGTEPTLFEFFDQGNDAGATPGGDPIFATPDFDLRFEGNAAALATPFGQGDVNREREGFYGVGGGRPPNPTVSAIIPDPFVTTPTTAGLINALGTVHVNVVGSGFYPNEVTTVCAGAPGARSGKTVSNTLALAIDNNGDAVPDVTLALTNVTTVSENLVRGTLAALSPSLPGTAFPLSALGPDGTVTLTTTFTTGDNNVFGAFTRTATGTFDLGHRAPVVLAVDRASGACGQTQEVVITGAAFFRGDGSPNVTRVFAVQQDNPSNVINATSFVIVDSGRIVATFNFGSANAGRTFLIFVSGPSGTSRNLTALPPGTPAVVPLGNEQGNPITFSCQPNQLVFGATNFNVTEDCTAATITVTRNESAGTATVDFATSDGTATQKGDYTTTSGTLTFGPGETAQTFNVLISEDAFAEGNETVNVTLSNPTGGFTLGGLTASTVTIVDDDAGPASPNPIDSTQTFVCQQYHDFLGRQPDAAGLAFWVGGIDSCGSDAGCREIKRTDTSAAFFLSIEFQETGYLVYRAYLAAFARSPVPLTYEEFLADTQRIGRGVIIGEPGALAKLEANKQAFFDDFVARPNFTAAYPPGLTAAQYVDALRANTGSAISQAERDALVAGLNAATETRATVLRKVAEDETLRQAEFSRAFVLTQYFGYLRRNPNDAPDADFSGFQFWLAKLNSFGGDFRAAEMVKAFILSVEYRSRFGAP